MEENHTGLIAFCQEENTPHCYNAGRIQYYLNSERVIRKDNASHLVYLCIEHSSNSVGDRLSDIYSHAFFDELRAYADFNHCTKLDACHNGSIRNNYGDFPYIGFTIPRSTLLGIVAIVILC